MKKIYLDNNATTAPCQEAVEALMQEVSLAPGNPSSIHSWGQAAKRRLNSYRETIAHYLSAKPHEIFFTSGGTESMNLLLRGMFSNQVTGHAITSSIEHACIHHTLIDLQKRGLDVTFLTPTPEGTVTLEAIKEVIRPDTRFICLFAVNSETGAKHDLNAIASFAEQQQIPLIVDGVAWLGKEELSLPAGISAIGFSGHKIHALQGTGFFLARSSFKLFPAFTGAFQEGGIRPGTENLPGIAALCKAVSLLNTVLPEAEHRMRTLRDHLEKELLLLVPHAKVHGGHNRICNVLNISLGSALGEDLLIALDLAGIAVSHGSACSSGSIAPSRVLTQMGIPSQESKSALRFSLSRYTTLEEIDDTIKAIRSILSSL